jgi:hypothetical protein
MLDVSGSLLRSFPTWGYGGARKLRYMPMPSGTVGVKAQQHAWKAPVTMRLQSRSEVSTEEGQQH